MPIQLQTGVSVLQDALNKTTKAKESAEYWLEHCFENPGWDAAGHGWNPEQLVEEIALQHRLINAWTVEIESFQEAITILELHCPGNNS